MLLLREAWPPTASITLWIGYSGRSDAGCIGNGRDNTAQGHAVEGRPPPSRRFPEEIGAETKDLPDDGPKDGGLRDRLELAAEVLRRHQ
jgi:hypothetical protein